MLLDATIFFDLLKLIVHRNDEKIHKLADDLFKVYTDNSSTVNNLDVKYCELYINICKEIITHKINLESHRIDVTNTFKRYLVRNFATDKYIQEALGSILDDEVPSNRLIDITNRLNNIVMWYMCKTYISKLYSNLNDSKTSYSIESQNDSLKNIRGLIDDFKTNITYIDNTRSRNDAVETINTRDIDSIRSAYSLYKERRINHVTKTGLQGLNKMFGPANGMALGESILFAARTHNYKSGILIKMPQWIVQYNEPPKCPGKIPMILFISLENEGYLNMVKMFKEMYISIKGCVPPATMSDDEIVNEIYSYFNKSDYVLIIERYLPAYFGYNEFVELFEKYESAGYRITNVIVDYLSQMKLINYGSSSTAGNHALLQTLYNNICNYTKSFGTTLITAHQLNRDASNIAASGVPYPVKRYSERHFADASSIAREVDVIIYQEIERDEQNNAWLTMNWGKHRYVDDTPEACKFAAFPFDPELGILDDINGEARHVRNIYNKSNKSSMSDIEAILGGM